MLQRGLNQRMDRSVQEGRTKSALGFGWRGGCCSVCRLRLLHGLRSGQSAGLALEHVSVATEGAPDRRQELHWLPAHGADIILRRDILDHRLSIDATTGRVLYVLAVEADDHIARLDTGGLGRAL
jgi:hypothetical protein